jgi:hypothetical protein
MMVRRTRIQTLPLVGVAAAGVVLGHWVAYRIGVPRAILREHLLAESGHAYWFMAVKMAVILGLTGGGALFIRHLRTERSGLQARVEAYSSVVVWLAVLQVIAFTATEVLERASSGAPVAGMFSHHLFVLGVAVQFLVACIGAFVVLVLSRTGALVGAALAARDRAPRAAAVRFRLRAELLGVAALASGPCGPRAPPRS